MQWFRVSLISLTIVIIPHTAARAQNPLAQDFTAQLQARVAIEMASKVCREHGYVTGDLNAWRVQHLAPLQYHQIENEFQHSLGAMLERSPERACEEVYDRFGPNGLDYRTPFFLTIDEWRQTQLRAGYKLDDPREIDCDGMLTVRQSRAVITGRRRACLVDLAGAGHDPLRPCEDGAVCHLTGAYRKMGPAQLPTYIIERIISVSLE